MVVFCFLSLRVCLCVSYLCVCCVCSLVCDVVRFVLCVLLCVCVVVCVFPLANLFGGMHH